MRIECAAKIPHVLQEDLKYRSFISYHRIMASIYLAEMKDGGGILYVFSN